MKLHEYNEMMSYVLRRRPMSMGGRVGFARGDFITKEGYGKGVKGSNIPLSEYEKEYKGITKYYNKTRSGKWSSLTPQQRNNFIKTFERNILKPRGLLKELKADPEKLEKQREYQREYMRKRRAQQKQTKIEENAQSD